ncbi:MAG: hypothetical protein K8R77_01960 [Anaerolineaceae bacterium]|nr:hypothetical protein [Anaerolineaceae bacterium]
MEPALDSTIALLQSQKMPVRLDYAIDQLRSKMMPDTLEEALGFLQDCYYHFVAMNAAAEMRPAALEAYLAEYHIPKTFSDLCQMISVVLFPLDEYSEIQEGEDWGDPRLIIPLAQSPFGNFSWDEWEEMLEDISSYGPNDSLAVFFRMIHLEVDKDDWQKANKHFGWNLSAPHLFKDDANRSFSYALFTTKMHEAGLEMYYKAYQLVNFGTGNRLLDFSLGDFFQGFVNEMFYFDAATLRDLTDLYQEGQPRITAYDEARCQAAPETLAQIAKIYREAYSLKPKQTLVEIFAGEVTEESRCQLETTSLQNCNF